MRSQSSFHGAAASSLSCVVLYKFAKGAQHGAAILATDSYIGLHLVVRDSGWIARAKRPWAGTLLDISSTVWAIVFFRFLAHKAF